jgi:sugar (pentulose or hexulose) kinase
VNTLKLPVSSILLDIGGTYVKSAVLVQDQESPQNIRKFSIPRFIESGTERAVIPTSQLLTVVDQAIESQKKSHSSIDRIYISGQMGGYVIEESGKFEIVSWQDKRSLESKYEKERIDLELWLKASDTFKETGSELRPGLPFFSLAITKPYARHSNTPSPFRSVISFITSYLTNFESNEMHITDAAASGFYNLRNNAWDSDLIRKLDESLILPSVRSEVTRVGFSSKFLLEVFTGVGDQQASLHGTEIEPGKIVVNIGTGGQVAGFQEASSSKDNFQFRPYFGGKEIRTITHLPSGRALNAFVDFCFPGEQQFDKYKEFELSCETPDFTSMIDLVNFDQTLNSLKANGYENKPEKVSSKFFGTLIQCYAAALTELDLEGELLFAGGVGQKVQIISRELSRASGREFSISNSQETTLEGLAKIARAQL